MGYFVIFCCPTSSRFRGTHFALYTDGSVIKSGCATRSSFCQKSSKCVASTSNVVLTNATTTFDVVDLTGVEPVISAMRMRRITNCATGPKKYFDYIKVSRQTRLAFKLVFTKCETAFDAVDPRGIEPLSKLCHSFILPVYDGPGKTVQSL